LPKVDRAYVDAVKGCNVEGVTAGIARGADPMCLHFTDADAETAAAGMAFLVSPTTCTIELAVANILADFRVQNAGPAKAGAIDEAVQVLQLVLAHGKGKLDVNCDTWEVGLTPLLIAIAQLQNADWQLKPVQLLLAAGARVDYGDVQITSSFVGSYWATSLVRDPANSPNVLHYVVSATTDIPVRKMGLVAELVSAGADPTQHFSGKLPVDDHAVDGTPAALSKALHGGNDDLTVLLETMAAHMAPGTEPAECTRMLGRMAKIDGVQSKPELNGKLCIPVKFQPGRNRLGVRVVDVDDQTRITLASGPLISLKAECLAVF